MDIKATDINHIGLSTRSANALRRANVTTVGDLLKCDRYSLTQIRNLGEKSINEIWGKIEEYKGYLNEGSIPEDVSTTNGIATAPGPQDNFEEWVNSSQGRSFIVSWLNKQGTKIDTLDSLSMGTYKILTAAGYSDLQKVIFMSDADLKNVPGMNEGAVSELKTACGAFLQDHSVDISNAYAEENGVSLYDMMTMPVYHKAIKKFTEENDKLISQMGLSNRAFNRLNLNGYEKLSDIVFLTRSDLLKIKSMGTSSADEITAYIRNFLETNKGRILAVARGDSSALWDDGAIRDKILAAYQELGFEGMSLKEMRERLKLPEEITDERLKKIIGGLLASGDLEYVDFRVYRVYYKFSEYIDKCPALDERDRGILHGRLAGDSLETIGNRYGITRERTRQLVVKAQNKARNQCFTDTGMKYFDEDYYAYFYGKYAVEKDEACKWLGFTPEILNYLELTGIKNGTEDIAGALDDRLNVEAGMRLKVNNYLNRNKLFLDGQWIDKNRASLEDYTVKKFCQDNLSFSEYAEKYNAFLKEQDIPYDESIYYTDTVFRTRQNRLSESRILLWKQNEMIRYYDIDARDYTDLLDTLNLDGYENVILSTDKFVQDYPDIMEKYDIRDKYELHNLLRKIVPDGSYHDFHCGKMPDIYFGKYDLNAQVMGVLVENAPVRMDDLAKKVGIEYGFDPRVVIGNYLQPFSLLCHNGVYSVDQKHMSAVHFTLLKNELKDDFYYVDEVREIYRRIAPEADIEEVNPYNLKNMGFQVFSRYILKGHDSMESYITKLLTKDDYVDITPIRKRCGSIQTYYDVSEKLRKNLSIIEYEPGKFMNFRKAEEQGITKDKIKDFCDQVYSFVSDGEYFTVRSIRKDGFMSELFSFGYSDLFYSSLLKPDPRFSYESVYAGTVFLKGKAVVTKKTFLTWLITQEKDISLSGLSALLSDNYGCSSFNKWDLTTDVLGTAVHYDRNNEHFYANEDIYVGGFDDTAEEAAI